MPYVMITHDAIFFLIIRSYVTKVLREKKKKFTLMARIVLAIFFA